MPSFPQNILFLAEGQLGDLLLLTPAIRAFKTTYPNSHVSVVIFHRRLPSDFAVEPGTVYCEDRDIGTAAVFAHNPHVDRVFNVFRAAIRELRSLERLRAEGMVIRALRRLRSDVVVCTFPEDRFALLAYASGARIRVGQRRQGLAWLLNRTPEIERSDSGVLEYYCGLAVAGGAKVESKETEFHLAASTRRWADEVLAGEGVLDGGKVIAVHPGASGDYKIWPPERYAQLIEQIRKDRSRRVFLCRGDADGPVADAILAHLSRPVPVIGTGNDIGKLGALLRRSDLCITNDSGPRHLAVAVQASSLALFRQHHGREWSVYAESRTCRTLHGAERCPACPEGECRDLCPPETQFGNWCMRMISVAEVIRCVDEFFERTTSS